MCRKQFVSIVLAAFAGILASAALGDGADEALALARRTYDYVAKSVDAKVLKPYARELAMDAQWLASASNAPAAWRGGIERAIRDLRRRILFLHPDLQFDKLIAVQRGIPYTWDLHMVDQYVGRLSRPGPGLVVLENWRGVPRKKVLLAGKLPEGTVINPDLHWDADRLLFAFCDHTAKPPPGFDPARHGFHSDMPPNPWIASVDPTHPVFAGKDGGFDKTAEVKLAHRRYFIWECAADGSWARQLTGVPGDPMETCEGRQTVLIEDIDPCYLPDGGMVFSSTRAQNFGRCHWGRWTPSFLLYRADLTPAGARNFRQLSFGEANEWEPAVLNDGRIAYTRWDYVNRNAVWHQSLWTIRPDGTGVAHLYGNYSERVCVGTEIKPLVGTPVCVATASAHHSLTQGSLFLLDARKGEDGDAPVTRITPECPFPESEGWNLPVTYCNPQPVNDTLFFCARSDEPMSFPKGHPRRHGGSCGASWPKPAAFGIWLVDTLGGRELIYKDPEISTFNPIPLVKRRKPPVLASVLPPADKAPASGVCYVENVYESRRDLPKGSVSALRVNRLINLPICCRRTTKLGPDLDLYKESLGTVPVEADGSAAFRIPSGVPIQLQAIDTNGMAILTMRSFIFTQRGEIQGCVGCHENRAQAMPAKPKEGTLARQKPVRDPVPEIDLGYRGAFSFARSVQPIFDRKCIACHGLSDKAPFSLVGIGAIANLNARRQIAFAKSYQETHYSKPYDYFAAASPLTKKLKGGHGPALAADEWKKLILWMDFNVPEYALSAGYGWNGPDAREIDPVGEKSLREAVRERLGEAIAAQPFDALVNRGDERLSRVLDLVGGEASPVYARFLALCKASLKPIPYTDRQGTCGRDEACRCRSCWVRCGGYNAPPK